MSRLGRRIVLLILILSGGALLCVRTIRGAEDGSAVEANSRKAYADKIRETYAFRFGKDEISLPGNAAAVGGDFLQASGFPNAAYCGHCHQEAYHEWRQALHSNAFRTPFYRASVNILIRTKGIEFSRHCDSCHNPIGVLSGALTKNSSLDRSRALTLHPDDARALYYLALVERRQRHSEAEVADLQKVVAQYPCSRDARRELGISYYQQHHSEQAMEQFKALQAIDPDDLAAHYNLAILYRRMGLKQQATREAALYTIKRVDPSAPTYSLDYLRKHPEISTESVPWHIHTDLTRALAAAGVGLQ
jgi:tetratricopeptide (TPR) repeat protein